MNTGVYILYHEYNPDKLYVGSTSCLGFKQRFNNHIKELSRNLHKNKFLQNVANKHGVEGFKFKVLQEIAPEYCIEAEQFWIDTLDSFKNGYNASRLARCVSMPFEERQIASLCNQKRVMQINSDNEVINTFKSLHEASRQTNINIHDISLCCNKKVKMAGGYLWCFEKDYHKDLKYTSKYNNFGLLQYDKKGNFIKRWDTIKEAANIYAKGNNGNIYKCCKDFTKSVYGYRWKYDVPK